jgi:hypothetical protein
LSDIKFGVPENHASGKIHAHYSGSLNYRELEYRASAGFEKSGLKMVSQIFSEVFINPE